MGAVGVELIERLIMPSHATSVTLSSIPSTYKHLELEVLLRMTVGAREDVYCRMNSDTGANYLHNRFWVQDVSTAAADTNTTGTTMTVGAVDSADGNQFASFRMLIPDYASTSTYKTVMLRFGLESTTEFQMGAGGAVWENSSNAISSLTFTNTGGYNFESGSTFTLYGWV